MRVSLPRDTGLQPVLAACRSGTALGPRESARAKRPVHRTVAVGGALGLCFVWGRQWAVCERSARLEKPCHVDSLARDEMPVHLRPILLVPRLSPRSSARRAGTMLASEGRST